MKVLLLFALLLPVFAIAQNKGGVFTIDAKKFGSNDRDVNYGFTISGGGILKQPGSTKQEGVLLGLGAGLHILKGNGGPYFPVFLELGYINRVKKIFPYINARGGYLFTDSKVNKGGLYSEFRGGVSVKAGACRFTPYIGLSISQYRTVSRGETLNSEHEGMFVGGIAFVFAR